MLSNVVYDSMIRYNANSRLTEAANFRTKAGSFSVQLRSALWLLVGPGGWFNSILSALIMGCTMPSADESMPSMGDLVFDVSVMVVLNDFALYWGHWIQHRSEFLWNNCHSFHHSIGVPATPSTTPLPAPVSVRLSALSAPFDLLLLSATVTVSVYSRSSCV